MADSYTNNDQQTLENRKSNVVSNNDAPTIAHKKKNRGKVRAKNIVTAKGTGSHVYDMTPPIVVQGHLCHMTQGNILRLQSHAQECNTGNRFMTRARLDVIQ